jgi:uncharacterized membrane protein YkvA (DUF1232 family)
MKLIKKIRVQIRHLKTEIYTLYLAYRDPRVKWYVKAFILLIIAYALSPVDIIPDFIPVLGYIDDLLILPLGIYLAIKMIPEEVKVECRLKARADLNNLRLRWIGLALVIAAWLIIVAGFILIIIKL